jgi:t-SNARE complex subunit (syntaxin)
MKDKGEAKKTILREMNFFKTKIDKIQADVTLWETNMGFFASSKNADLLKQEFEKKIAKAKEEINTFKAKIRQLDKMKRGLDEKPKEETTSEEA